MKRSDIKYSYKKVIGFTETQKETLLKLESLGYNINQFIRSAVSEKIQRDRNDISIKKKRILYKNMPQWMYDKN